MSCLLNSCQFEFVLLGFTVAVFYFGALVVVLYCLMEILGRGLAWLLFYRSKSKTS
jgi:hypothetical protein